MSNFKFLSALRIKADEMILDSRNYISRLYNRAGEMFTSASPFSQILDVINEITGLIFYYIEDSVVEQNILTAQHPESVYGLSRLVGHDPFRGNSAVGEIKIRLNVKALSEIIGDSIIIPGGAEIVANGNGLKYFISTSDSEIRINKSNLDYIYLPVTQGIKESQTLTSTGESLQSFNIIIRSKTDHNWVKVSVNGEPWTKYDSIYDMNQETKGFLVKTGINDGLDIYFGNGSYGMIPPQGALILVEYIKTDGRLGNLDPGKDITFKFNVEGLDPNENIYNLNEILEFDFSQVPSLGADREDIALTRLIAPLQSNSFILATPKNYEYFLSRYQMFSYLDVYNTTDDEYLDDDNIIYIFATPDIKRKLTSNKDYFNLDLNEFFFSAAEQNSILKLLEDSGQQMVTTDVQWVQPKVKYFAMNVKVRYFEGYYKENLSNQIRSKISEYLLNITRRDRLPKSDIIAILEAIDGIDSVSINFVSKTEEDARRLGYYISTRKVVTPSTPILEQIGNGKQRYVFFKKTIIENKINIQPGDPLPQSTVSLDSFGDIILEKDEVALFRGGWSLRDDTLIKDDVSLGEPAALSIYFDEPAVPNTVFTQIQTQNRKKI